MFIEKQKLKQDITTKSTNMAGTSKQSKVVTTINELFKLDKKKLSSFSTQLCGKVVSHVDGKLSTLRATLLFKMPSNLKGKNFVSTFPGYCPQNTMTFFSLKLDGIKK